MLMVIKGIRLNSKGYAIMSGKVYLDFEDYLRQNALEGKRDFLIRAEIREDRTTFYIHPANEDGDTIDLEVISDKVFLRDDILKGK